MFRIIAALSLAFCVIGCAVREKVSSTPRVAHTIETFQKSSGNCQGDSIPCATYEVSFPVFTGLDTAVLRSLQSRIEAAVSMGNPEAAGWDMERIATDFIKGFTTFNQENPDMPAGSWYYKGNIAVPVQTDTLISLTVNEEYFTGGAHGGAGTYFINIHPSTGKDITLDDVLKPGYRPVLTRIAEQAFREARELADTASFADNGFEFPENQFTLSDNYGFTPDGIVFVFNSYEIGPYALGPTTLVVPYEKLKDWLK